jgi:hypothetical protein
MIDRFEKFTDEELHELRYGLRLAQNARRYRSEERELRDRLDTEIAHVQIQREHRTHREALPA